MSLQGGTRKEASLWQSAARRSLFSEFSCLGAELPGGTWGRLELQFSRSHANTPPTRPVSKSSFQLPHSAPPAPRAVRPVCRAWYVAGSREERQDQSGEVAWTAPGPCCHEAQAGQHPAPRGPRPPRMPQTLRVAEGRGLGARNPGEPPAKSFLSDPDRRQLLGCREGKERGLGAERTSH